MELSKDAAYRQRHPERVKESNRRHYHANKEMYAIKRRERYLANREGILGRVRADRVECPFCTNITFHIVSVEAHQNTSQNGPD